MMAVKMQNEENEKVTQQDLEYGKKKKKKKKKNEKKVKKVIIRNTTYPELLSPQARTHS